MEPNTYCCLMPGQRRGYPEVHRGRRGEREREEAGQEGAAEGGEGGESPEEGGGNEETGQ